MAIDFMGVMRRCARCKSSEDDVCWSDELEMYVCDKCYEELMRIDYERQQTDR